MSSEGHFRALAGRLDEAEERFRVAFENAPIGIALVSPGRRWLQVNRALCEITGYDEAALLEKTPRDITHPDDRDADTELVRRMLAGEIRTAEAEKRFIRADGSSVWVLLSVALVRDADDRPRYLISQFVDIDQRKRATETFTRLLESGPDAMVIVNGDGEIQLANAETERMFVGARRRRYGAPRSATGTCSSNPRSVSRRSRPQACRWRSTPCGRR